MCWDQTVVNKLYKQASDVSVPSECLRGGSILSSFHFAFPQLPSLSENWRWRQIGLDTLEALLIWHPALAGDWVWVLCGEDSEVCNLVPGENRISTERSSYKMDNS